MGINPLFSSKPFLAAVFLLTVFSAWAYDEPNNQGQVLGTIDFHLVPTSNFPASPAGGQSPTIQPPAPLPIQTSQNLPIPQLTAKAALILDRASHTILFKKNTHQKLPPASTTKIMTALLTLEKLPLDQIVTAGKVVNGDNGSSMHLLAGEQITVENLLWGLLLNSGNDAAAVLAQNIGEKQFISLMNQKADLLHLQNTHFENPVGFDQLNHFSTAYDLAILANAALKYPVFAQMVATPQKLAFSVDGKISHPLYSTNPLLGKIEGVQGVKTGSSEAAEECLVVLVKREGHEVLIVILGSQNREQDARGLIDWVFYNFAWE